MRMFLVLIVFALGCKKNQQAPVVDPFAGVTSQTFMKTTGCFIVMFAIQFDSTRQVSIILNENNLDLQTIAKTYKIEDHPADIKIAYYTHASSRDSVYFFYCDDAVPRNLARLKTKWNAVSGTVSSVVSKNRNSRGMCENYVASVKLENLRFVKENSTQDTTIQLLVLKDRQIQRCIP